MKTRNTLVLPILLCLAVLPPAVFGQCCLAPDNGSGTVDFPADCPYDHDFVPMVIVEGLPPGTMIELRGPITDFYNVVNSPGGTLGGERCTFDAFIDWTVTGTGDLAGFNRHLYVPVSGEIHIGPRTPGDPVQSFPARIYGLEGELFGDPDFCTLRIRSGDAEGLPSPGHTILTDYPTDKFDVESFFDITYEIDFEGCPGSQIQDYMGTTQGFAPRTTCFDTTYTADWCRLQWPHSISTWSGQAVTVYGRLYIAGLTDQTTGNDPVPAVVRGQVGYGPEGSDPSAGGWTWFEAFPNPAWDGGSAGEPNNDEYMASMVTPAEGGTYDYAYRFSGNAGATWLYGDRDTGLPGEDGSQNGYQPANAGKMTVREVCCSEPDNGSGTIDFPAGCPYDHPSIPMMIINGLPPLTTIELAGPLTGFYNVVNTPGGTLGGEVCTFDAYLDWTATGTGDLEGFNRHLYVPVSGEMHIAPRTPGDPVQSFAAKIFDLQGELFGDPDFCTLRFTAGDDNGLACPGQAILTELPDGDFNVESFFDITYTVEFEGCPGSQLTDYMGTTLDTVPRTTCYDLTYTIDWCRLQWPHTIYDWPDQPVTVYGRVYIEGLTDRSAGNDATPGIVRGQAGYGPSGSDPSSNPSAWTWFEAYANPGWDGGAAGEPDNDEYMAVLVTPPEGGDYDFCYRFSGDVGATWLYGDKDTGMPGEDGSENGYQATNAGKMTVKSVCCKAIDNGTYTCYFPPDCPYDHPAEPMMIIEGLPPGTTIELAGPLTDFYNVSNVPGGTLGGEICTFDAFFDWTVTGTGDLEGFNRHLYVPVSGEIHIAPRVLGDSIQPFAAKIYTLAGELFGDPDFCTLRVRSGQTLGLPSPGQAVLTRIPGGYYSVDSFFDITYEIEFEGCPASQIEDYMGTTMDMVPRTTCFDTTYTADWCRLQWPDTIEAWGGQEVTVYGRLYVAGVTDQTTGNDPVPAVIRGQVGYGPPGSDPSLAAWTWFEAGPNPAWDAGAAGEPDNDEYMAALVTPLTGGSYDFCYRFSGDAGATWLYGDRKTGAAGEDGSENGYQPANAGKMAIQPVCCQAPDNGSGTVTFPPDCPYDSETEPMMIVDGLPPGTTIEMWGPITDITNVVNTPGGSLGGEICTFDAALEWAAKGTGDLAGFNRNLWVPVTGEIHIAPRTPGDSIQAFEGAVYRITGELFGDPDFCTLRFRAGSYYGLPGPGTTVLSELPSGDFAVESFFDITYQIEFEGCPASQIEDYMGTTTDTVRRMTCYEYAGVDKRPDLPEAPERLTLSPGAPNPFMGATRIAYAVPYTGGDSRVTLKIYDAMGRLVHTIVDADKPAGRYTVTWDGRDSAGRSVAPGVYFSRLRLGRKAVTQRVVLLR